MDLPQTADDYRTYFYNKFITLFQTFVKECIVKVSNDEILSSLKKIEQLFPKLNYEKIINKMCENTKLQEDMTYLAKNNFNDELLKTFCSTTTSWSLMPGMYINKIFNDILSTDRTVLYNNLHSLYICAVTYNKVLNSMQKKDSNNALLNSNGFETTETGHNNVDIDTLFNGVEVKTYSAIEMIMEQFVNQQMDGKMLNYMDDIQEDEVNIAADKLTDVLNNENFNSNKHTTKILSDMLCKIKNEVVNLKNEPLENTRGKKGVEQLLGIAQKVAGNMMSSIKENNINVLDLWDATSNLAKSTTNSSALNIVDKLIRTNIENNLKNANMQQNQQTDASTTQTKEQIKKERKMKRLLKKCRDAK
jgi:hypothetical protein